MIQLYCLRFVLVTMCLRSVEAGEHAVVIEAESDKFEVFFILCIKEGKTHLHFESPHRLCYLLPLTSEVNKSRGEDAFGRVDE